MAFNPFRHREIPGRVDLVVAVLLTTLFGAFDGALSAQDGDWSVLRAGEVRLGILGGFSWADERYDDDGGALALSAVFDRSNGATLFPEYDRLAASLETVTGSGLGTPFLGPTEATMQVSRTELPIKIELGLFSWLTLGATLPFLRSRVEGEVGVFPSGIASVGLNPSLVDYDGVLAFTRELQDAAASLPGGQATVWGEWADAWVDAYAASAVFPAFGTNAGDALLASLDEFNAVLAAAGVPQVGLAVPMADGTLTRDETRQLLQDPTGPFQYYPLSRPLLWGLGDVEIEGRLKIFEAGLREATGRPGYGLTAMGRVRLPTAAGPDPRAIYEIPRGDSQLDFEAGAATWLRGGRLGVAAALTYTFSRAGTVLRRVAPIDVPLVPVVNTAEVEWTPGNQLAFELRPSFALGDPLFIELRYRYRSKDMDTFERVSPEPEFGEPIPYPEGYLGYDVSVLAEGTESSFQTLGGGLRYHPPAGDFPVEVWANVEYAISGSGARTLKRSRAEFGGRLYYQLWGR